MNGHSLREELKQIEDVRRGAGQRHSIDVILMITIMATMSGYTGHRAIGDFVAAFPDKGLGEEKEKRGLVTMTTLFCKRGDSIFHT